MAEPFQFAHRIAFEPENAEAILREVPARAGVFALRGERETDQPYLTRAADLRRRMRRLLAPPEAVDAQGQPVLSKRLNLRERVRRIEWAETGSEFESVLVLYRALVADFGADDARKRMRLHTPYFLRVTMGHEHPRLYITNRLSRRAMSEMFGPFASRAAAERTAEAVGEIFRLRRCHEDLEVSPEHPGCVYGEIGRCMAPCRMVCSKEEYAAEAQAALAYLRSRGESLTTEIAARRDAASEAMDFEAAAALHRQWEKAKAVAASADPLVRAATEVRALVVQQAARDDDGERTDEAAIFLLDKGCLVGPERLSTLGVRPVREQTAVGSSLFAQPLMLSAVPEGAAPDVAEMAPTLSPEERARAVLGRLEELAPAQTTEIPEAGDALALFKRWYYRPEKSRAGEVLLPNPDGSWPVRRLLNAAARVVLGPPAEVQTVDREGANALAAAARDEQKMRVLHPGREGVERMVPALPRRKRTRAAVPSDALG